MRFNVLHEIDSIRIHQEIIATEMKRIQGAIIENINQSIQSTIYIP